MYYFSSLTQMVMWGITITLRPSLSPVFVLHIQHSSRPRSQPNVMHAFDKQFDIALFVSKTKKKISMRAKRDQNPKCLASSGSTCTTGLASSGSTFTTGLASSGSTFTTGLGLSVFNLNKESCLLGHVFRIVLPSLDDD